MAYQRTYCKAEVLRIIENQDWNFSEFIGNTGCTSIHVGHKADGNYFGIFDNFDGDVPGSDCYRFNLTVKGF
jgi:hypothetical protein